MSSTRTPSKFADAVSTAIDKVRRAVHGPLGTRTYRVQIVRRTWSGESIGEGTPLVSVLELDPRPKFEPRDAGRMSPGGREQIGGAVLTEVSLGYTMEDLSPRTNAATEEFAYRVIDTGGQNSDDQWFTLESDPRTRRGDNRGDNSDWMIALKTAAPMTDLDGVDS